MTVDGHIGADIDLAPPSPWPAVVLLGLAGVLIAGATGLYLKAKWEAEKRAEEEGGLLWRWRVPLLLLAISVAAVVFAYNNNQGDGFLQVDPLGRAEAKAHQAKNKVEEGGHEALQHMQQLPALAWKGKQVAKEAGKDAVSSIESNMPNHPQRKFLAGFIAGLLVVMVLRNQVGFGDGNRATTRMLFYT